MGEAKRRKISGNIEPDHNWRRKLTSEELHQAVTRGVEGAISGIMRDWNDMSKRT